MNRKTVTYPKSEKSYPKALSIGLLLLPLAVFFSALNAHSQPIIPATDGTGTLVTPEGVRYDITGGQRSSDGRNLFHSFTEFGLNPAEVANFISNPTIVNILGRINGGNVSYINGLIQVTGGASHLYLMNPAGMVFGPNASLNVPGSFLATTATGMGFDEGWFQAVGENSYANLVGTPSALVFETLQPGAIINSGNLTVVAGQNLTLIGGTILNQGTVASPQGNITMATVSGSSWVRLSQPHHLLSLDISAPFPVAPIALPALLTGGNSSHVTDVRINPDGTVELSGSGLGIAAGDVAMSQSHIAGQTISLSAHQNLTLGETTLQTTGDMQLRAGDTVRVRDSLDRPFLADAGGNLSLRGDRAIDILALDSILWVDQVKFQFEPFRAGGDITLVSDGPISGDSHFAAGGNFAIRTGSGEPGTLISLFDPIVTSNGDVTFGDYTGASLKVEAGGSIIGVSINITQPDTTLTGSDPDIPILTSSPSVILRAGEANLSNAANVPPDQAIADTIFSGSESFSGGSITVNNITTAGGPAILSATSNIITGNLNTNGGDISVLSRTGNIITAGEVVSLGTTVNGNINLDAGNTLSLEIVNSGSGNITLTGNEIDLNDTITSTGILTLQPRNPNQTIVLSGGSDSGNTVLDLTVADLAALEDGFSSIIIGAENSTGLISIAGPVNFRDPVTLRSPQGQGATDIAGNITLSDNATLNIDTAGATLVSADVITEGELSFGNIFLNADVTFAGSNIIFNGTIDGERQLTVSSPLGTVAVNQPVGSQVPLGSLDIVADVLTLSSDIVAQGNIILNSAVILGNDIRLSTLTPGSLITFNNTLNSQENAAQSLTLNTAGSVIFTREIGGGEGGALGAIAIEETTEMTASEKITADRLTVNSAGTIVLEDVNLVGENANLTTPVLELNATEEIAVGNVTANPGQISLTSTNSFVTIGDVTSPGGTLEVTAGREITTGILNTSTTTGTGGEITLTSTSSRILTEEINTSGLFGGGNLTISACESCQGIDGEPLTLGIQTGTIATNATEQAAGDVNLMAPGDIQVRSIRAEGSTGGTAEITTGRFFRATDTLLDANSPDASISTAGLSEEGEIKISHGSAIAQAPLIIGDAQLNGTLAAIMTDGNNMIVPVQSFPFSFTQGNISLVSAATEPSIIIPPVPIPESSPSLDLPDNLLQTQLERPPEAQPLIQLESRQLDSRILPNDRVATARLALDDFLNQGNENLGATIEQIEGLRQSEFETYFQEDLGVELLSFEEIVQKLRRISKETGTNPAIVYVLSRGDRLDLLLVTPQGQPIHRVIEEANQEDLLSTARNLSAQITDLKRLNTQTYLPPARQLYQWLIAPIAAELESEEIDTIAFSMDAGLRTLPVAALHDGEQFLVEKYRLGLIPSLNLTDTRYQDIRNFPVLAMGSSTFRTLPNLPAVALELEAIIQILENGRSFLNEEFTLENLKFQRATQPFQLVHLATHGQFNPGDPRDSYIQLWDGPINLQQMRDLEWNNPPVDLLVLSACRTAIGSLEAELGFAGLAVRIGAKTAIASLTYVSDEATFALMTEFYQNLKTAPIKAEALRQAQIAMLEGRVRFEGDFLYSESRNFALRSEGINENLTRDFKHPYYWAVFTLIGSPW
ncbi:filamentous hemagglutinin family N-terminal domain protein [Oscillatoria acuminata PCC 6304]|uniref:Filamentous hemagglutinin family N-terminal domain protein n=2 Tax=Oscillatoria acuminata TaxID=118323 RepID=K9THD3_9CYAN|nr:filamentous hemagglutinin family N-terminal domain protein [Oscillatoria acuminata PCC 6304]